MGTILVGLIGALPQQSYAVWQGVVTRPSHVVKSSLMDNLVSGELPSPRK